MPDVGQGGGGAHPTFTGNRLDPNFQESQPSYHEEALADKTHEGAGWRQGTGLTGTSHDSHGHGHHHHGTTATAPTTSSSTRGTTGQDPYSLGTSGTTSSRDPYAATTGTNEPSSHNYGRDAALGAGAAGAGAAGYGLMSKGQGEPVDTTATGPASKTVGPHSSNFMNVIDPRVKPEPEKMHEHTTTGPHQSDTFNKMDPRVKDTEPSRQAGMQGASYGGDNSYGRDNSHGRDAALIGAGGVAGAGAYSAYDSGRQEPGTMKSAYDTTQAPTGTTMTQERGAPAPTVPRESTTGTSTRHDPTSTHGHHDPYTKEHHADREAENREQTKGGMFGFLHKHQDPKYQDKAEPDTTARDKFYGTDHVTHPRDAAYDDRTRSGPSAGTATAVGAGTAGVAGAGAYAASRSSGFDHHDPTGPGLTHGSSSRDYESGYRHNPLKQSSHEAFYHDSTGPGMTHGTSSGTSSGYGAPGAGMLAPGQTTASALPGDRKDTAAMGGAGGHHGDTSSHDYGTGKSSTGTGESYDDGRQSFDESGRPKEKRGLMDRILHREHPNKLHKEPPS